jgi:16S rRNA (adenine1518-N6/adenine1519-N6)-dimethyltransferase
MIFARKRFGQHFLHDRGIIERIAAALGPAADDALVEIGPGRGALTELLIRSMSTGGARTLDAIEIDRDLARDLNERWGSTPGFRLHEADALDFDFAALSAERGSQRLRVIGNLPYNISTPLLFHLASQHEHIDDLHVMLQKEVIERIAASPGSSDYGRLTVMLAPWFETNHLFDVGPGAFSPPPKVWSAVARLTVRRTPAFDIPPAFARTVSAAFSHRRKTLRNALRGVADPAAVMDAIVAAGVDPGARPETVSPAQFAAIAQRVGDLVPEA